MSFWPACPVEGCWVSRNPQARATIWPQPAGRATRLWKHELLGPRPLQAPCAMYQCNGVLPCSQSTLLLRVLLHAGAVPPLTQFRRMGSSPSSHLWSRHHSAHKFTITILFTRNFLKNWIKRKEKPKPSTPCQGQLALGFHKFNHHSLSASHHSESAKFILTDLYVVKPASTWLPDSLSSGFRNGIKSVEIHRYKFKRKALILNYLPRPIGSRASQVRSPIKTQIALDSIT